MIVTTPRQCPPALIEYANGLAAELGGRYVPRRRETLSGLKTLYGDARLLVADERGLRYYEDSDEPFYFHPSMAYVRVKRLRRGERDPLVELSGCRPGDTVLDCTAGLGSDAIVFSYAAGPEGRVTALESEQLLYTIVREGLKTYATDHHDVNEALRRIDVRLADHREYLAALPDNSADIVYFDPMFRQPIHESAALQPLRALANPSALSADTIRHAVRVARRSVVMKEHRESGEFERLGFRLRHANKIAYGVITPP
ncbi:class I SAM-dependent methyltransferase [Paenibacillus humicola]|uniref:class I SAM-dependent methyltransferase n=1 Tax=Paenibacillus humicola TaxID=3110540 RepID=UPI00237BECC4|nr:class I SAM-dependent methyltransferase [Paenibacillus humicola]